MNELNVKVIFDEKGQTFDDIMCGVIDKFIIKNIVNTLKNNVNVI
ncbi:MAG: hypothetical protein PHP54_04250 [Clostridia bacterium]|nr:hypothetical protein [Clostridia bacterium]